MPKTSLVAAGPEFQRALRGWYQAHARPLPWRENPSLYKTVVSEFMLQQTQVKTVLPYFARWVRALPDFRALAAAPGDEVLKLWEGLGYYSRARNLQRLAQQFVSRTEPPRTPAGWLEFAGVGPYTAAAITSISFDAAAACVDGNVIRILARLTADGTRHANSAAAARKFAPLADALLPDHDPGTHNQAMMELGATVCLRTNPACGHCPVRRFCAAAATGRPEQFPRFAPRQLEARIVTRVWCERGGALLLHRAPPDAKRFAGLHELPLAEHTGLSEAKAAAGELLARRRRTITRFQITESIHRAPPPAGIAGTTLVWVPVSRLQTVPLSGPHRRWVGEILERRGGQLPRRT